jgi:hypothetical protein
MNFYLKHLSTDEVCHSRKEKCFLHQKALVFDIFAADLLSPHSLDVSVFIALYEIINLM